MLKRQPWRRLVHQFCAVTILRSVLSVGADALAPSGGAATTPTSGTTFVGGTNRNSPLCRKSHSGILGIRREPSDVQMLKSGKWSPAHKRSLIDFYGVLSQLSQAVIARGREVPANVLTAARQAVKNVPVLERIVRKANNTAELNASMEKAEFISCSVLSLVSLSTSGNSVVRNKGRSVVSADSWELQMSPSVPERRARGSVRVLGLRGNGYVLPRRSRWSRKGRQKFVSFRISHDEETPVFVSVIRSPPRASTRLLTAPMSGPEISR